MTTKIAEVDKRKHTCPSCGAAPGQPCRTQPRSGHGYPIPPMPLTQAHRARARLARSAAVDLGRLGRARAVVREYTADPAAVGMPSLDGDSHASEDRLGCSLMEHTAWLSSATEADIRDWAATWDATTSS